MPLLASVLELPPLHRRGVLAWHCTKLRGATLQADLGVCRAATTLCALHYIACSVSIWVTQTFGGVKRVTLPFSGDPERHCRFTATVASPPLCYVSRPLS